MNGDHVVNAFQPVCLFDKVFASFWYLTRKNSHKNKTHVNWHSQFRFWHVMWLVKEKKTTCRSTLYKLKQHILPGIWHRGDISERTIDVTWHPLKYIWKHHMTLWIRSWMSYEICQIYTLIPTPVGGPSVNTLKYDIQFHWLFGTTQCYIYLLYISTKEKSVIWTE
jgi:hypothetical protein